MPFFAAVDVSDSLQQALDSFFGFLPNLLGFLVILLIGWEYADPVVGALIGLLVLASSWSILRDSIDVLLERSPRGIDVEQVGSAMAAADGVREVHDLHVWEITSGFPALSAHLLVGRDTDCHAVRRSIEELLHDRFGLEHTTLQVDHEGGELLQIEVPDGRG